MRVFRASAVSLAILALVSCGQAPQGKEAETPVKSPTTATTVTTITIEDPWIQLPAVRGRPGAAYFTFRVEGDPDELVSVTTPAAKGTAMHETRLEGGVARMAPVGDLTLQEGKPLGFSPGAKHIMLLGVDPTVKAGSTVPITFTFRRTAPITTEAEVRAFGEGNAAH